MSTYEMLFPGAAPHIALNILDRMRLPRLNYRVRDVWIEPGAGDTSVMRILTRIGGGNRGAYAEQIRELQSHPQYLNDRDETDWDSTYASFYFTVPDLPQFTVDMLREEAPVNLKERAGAALKAASERWERGEYTEAEARIRDALTGDAPGGIIEI